MHTRRTAAGSAGPALRPCAFPPHFDERADGALLLVKRHALERHQLARPEHIADFFKQPGNGEVAFAANVDSKVEVAG